MAYTIVVKNGVETTTIHDVSQGKIVFNKKMVKQTGCVTTMEFTVDNSFDKSLIQYHQTEVFVYDNEKMIFKGRSITSSEDLYNNGLVECEGVLAYLNDTFYTQKRFFGRLEELYTSFIENHNANVEAKKRFIVGDVEVTSPNTTVFVIIPFKELVNTRAAVKKYFETDYGAVLDVECTETENILHCKRSYGKYSSQEIKLGSNLLDVDITVDYKDIITVLIPLGYKDVDSGDVLDITSVNDGEKYIVNQEAVNRYGYIQGVAQWQDEKDAEKLKESAEQYLLTHSRPTTTIRIKAVDLHMVDGEIDNFEIGDWIKVVIPTHGIDDYYQLNKIEYDLDNPEESVITLGSVEQSLSDSTAKEIASVTDTVDRYVSSLVATNIKVAGKVEAEVVEALVGDFEDFTAADAEFKQAYAAKMTITDAAISDLNAEVGNIKEVYAQKATVEELTANVAELDTLYAGKFEVAEGNITNLTAKVATMETTHTNDLQAVNASIQTVSGDLASFKEGEFNTLEARVAEINSLYVSTGTFEDLEADVALLGTTLTDEITAVEGQISILETNYARIEDLESKYARVEELRAEVANLDSIYAKDADVDALLADYATVESLSAVEGNVTNLTSEIATIDTTLTNKLTAAEGNITTLQTKTASIEALYAKTADVNSLLADYVEVTELNATNASITTLQAKVTEIDNAYMNKAEVNTLVTNKGYLVEADIESVYAKIANINTLVAGTATIEGINGEIANIKVITAKSITTDNLSAKVSELGYATAEGLTATNASIANLQANVAQMDAVLAGKLEADDLNAINASIESLNANAITTSTLDAAVANLTYVKAGTVSATYATISALNTEKARIDTLNTSKADVTDLNAINANVGNLTTDVASINTALANKVETSVLEANYATITALNAEKARIDELDTNSAKINTLIYGSASGTSISSTFANAVVSVVGNAQIKSAMIENLAFEKLTGVEIDTTTMTIKSQDGKSQWTDNTIQISDSNRVRVQLGKDASNDYNLYIWDAAGNLMFDAQGLKADGIKSGIIRNDMVASNANIDGNKLNIQTVVSAIDGSTYTFSSSHLTYNGEVLDLFLGNINTTVTEQGETISNQGTQITALQGNITNKIWQTDINTATNELNTQITTVEQTANKINWLVASGTASSNFTLTDRTITAIADKFVIKDSTGSNTVISGGKITATSLEAISAKIGGFDIGSSYLANGTSALATGDTSVYLGLDGISCGTDFSVTREGVLSATNADIKGRITADSLTVSTKVPFIDGSGKYYKFTMLTTSSPTTGELYGVTFNSQTFSSQSDTTEDEYVRVGLWDEMGLYVFTSGRVALDAEKGVRVLNVEGLGASPSSLLVLNSQGDIKRSSPNELFADAGNANKPIYFSDGVPVACTYTLEKSVPADAKFTDTTYTLASFGISASASELNYVDGVTSNIQTQLNGKLDKLTYEWKKGINFGSSGKLYVGRFKMYDSNITIEFACTTSTTYGGKLVIATQNGVIKKVSVYGDATNELTSRLFIKGEGVGAETASRQWIQIYFNPPSWSKNIVHVQAQAIDACDTSVLCTSVTDVPADYTDTPTNELQVKLDSKANTSHTHSYAASSSAGGAATSANKLNTDAGSSVKPVYFSGGIPVACTYSLEKSVPSDAVFTDTTYSLVSTSANGLMAAVDKIKLNATNIAYATCDTAAGTAAKEVTIVGNDNWKLQEGSMIVVMFANSNTASSVTLNVNGTGAKSIWYSTSAYTSSSTTVCGYKNRTVTYMYNGTYWVWISHGVDSNSTYSNATLGQGYGTCSTTEAATAKVVTLSSYALITGGIVAVKFTNAVPANSTLNINSRGAKAIYYRGSAIRTDIIKAGDIATFIYNGSQYHLLTVDRDEDTTYYLTSFGVTASATELNYVDGVTSNIQTQLDGKLSTSGTAAKATKLATARTIRTNLGSTSAVSFDGSANITPGVSGTLAVGNGGTGSTTAVGARTNLGITSGTWTPSIYGFSSSGIVKSGHYIKIGDVVTVTFFVSGTGDNSQLYIDGASLPFTPDADTRWYAGGGHVQGCRTLSTQPDSYFTGWILDTANSNNIYARAARRTTASDGSAEHTASYMYASTGSIYVAGSLTYKIAD